MPAELRVSIVMPTHNRRERLARVLSGLDRQSVPPECFEVVVVDDGSTDDTAAWLAANQTRRYALRSLRQQNGGPARARNAGIEAAQAPLILFLDDDVEPTEHLVAEHLRSHDAEADVVVMGPLASVAHYAEPWVAWEQAKLEAQYAAMSRGEWEPTYRQFWTGNASVAKAHVLAVGGFDVTLRRAEDVALARRLHQRGLRFRFNPAARGLHHAERPLSAWMAMHKSYGAIEVQIFGAIDERTLVSTLAGNWSRLHPATRFLVRRCLGKPLRQSLASNALERWLRLAKRTGVPLATEQVCGALANLIYWEASVEALGEERAARVFALGDAIRLGTATESVESTDELG